MYVHSCVGLWSGVTDSAIICNINIMGRKALNKIVVKRNFI